MPKKATARAAKRNAKKPRPSRRRAQNQFTDTDRFDALDAWLVQAEDGDLLEFRFDAKAKHVRVGKYAGADLRSALDTFIEGEFSYSLLLDNLGAEELKSLVQAGRDEIRAQGKKRSKRT